MADDKVTLGSASKAFTEAVGNLMELGCSLRIVEDTIIIDVPDKDAPETKLALEESGWQRGNVSDDLGVVRDVWHYYIGHC